MHDCPECAETCDCLAGDIVRWNCTHCDDLIIVRLASGKIVARTPDELLKRPTPPRPRP